MLPSGYRALPLGNMFLNLKRIALLKHDVYGNAQPGEPIKIRLKNRTNDSFLYEQLGRSFVVSFALDSEDQA